MRWAVWLAAAGIALVGAGTASAGCMATVGLSPQPDVAAGETWTANIQVLQHGQTPMADATPSVIIANAATGEERTFPATLSDPEDGVYVASVVFPTAGSWSVAVNDGFPVAECAQTHTFGAHTIAAPASGAVANDEAGGSVALPLGLGLGLGLVAAVAATLAARARRNREAGLA
jgi:YtkA-like protein